MSEETLALIRTALNGDDVAKKDAALRRASETIEVLQEEINQATGYADQRDERVAELEADNRRLQDENERLRTGDS